MPRHSGRHFDIQPLMRIMGAESIREFADSTGISLAYARKMASRGVSEVGADRMAIRAGFHPASIWEDWFQDEGEPDDIGDLFNLIWLETADG